MRREMVTVPALLAFTGYALQAGHGYFAIASLLCAALDALTGRS